MRKYILLMLVTVVLLAPVLMAKEAKSLIISTDVDGLMEDTKGNIFAILREHGVVSEGSEITIEKDNQKYKARILEIKPDSLKIKLLGPVVAQPKPVKKVYELRDPFWPAGHIPVE